MSSAVAQRIFIDLKPVVSIDEKINALYGILSEVEGFENVYWGYNVESLDQLEILLRKSPALTAFSAFKNFQLTIETSMELPLFATLLPRNYRTI